MSKADYKAMVKETEEYHRLKENRVPNELIWWYFNTVGKYSLHNDRKHLERGVLSLDWTYTIDSDGEGCTLEALIPSEDYPFSYRESLPIMDQITDRRLRSIIESFSPRKRLIVELLVQNYTGVEIAHYLGISPAAVSKHLSAIREALRPYHDAYYDSYDAYC